MTDPAVLRPDLLPYLAAWLLLVVFVTVAYDDDEWWPK